MMRAHPASEENATLDELIASTSDYLSSAQAERFLVCHHNSYYERKFENAN
tara:strand:- start:572 stop:724 length:153 start_codon:yes stop_codon:yes gene_type:complete